MKPIKWPKKMTFDEKEAFLFQELGKLYGQDLMEEATKQTEENGCGEPPTTATALFESILDSAGFAELVDFDAKIEALIAEHIGYEGPKDKEEIDLNECGPYTYGPDPSKN